MLAKIMTLIGRRPHRPPPRRFGNLDPLADKVRYLVRRALEQRFDAAAHGMAEDDDRPHLERPYREFDRGTDAVRLVVRPVRRHQIGDVADDEQFAGGGIEDHLGVGAAVRAGDHQGTGLLPEPAQLLEPGAFVPPGAGAETVIAFDQIVHSFAIYRFARLLRTRYAAKQEGCPKGPQ